VEDLFAKRESNNNKHSTAPGGGKDMGVAPSSIFPFSCPACGMDVGALAQQHHKRHPDDGKWRVRPTSLDRATVINYTSQIKRVIFILDDQVLIYRSEKSVNVIERHKILSSVLLSLRVID